jgi:sulfatase modifying factor 1
MKTKKLLTSGTITALITSASASVTIDWVSVGNAGNAADPLTGYGAVAYEYKIGKYEVTNAQYGAFLNATAKTDSHGLYNSSMSSYGISRSGSSGNYTYTVTTALANRPVVYVSWFDAARFANWLVNGQSAGSTETGAYTLNGATSGIILANAGAQVYIPTENEWYKAAYYNATIQTYSLYPNGQNSITTSDANYSRSVGSATDVGSYSNDPSSYGTFDQGGNLSEWFDEYYLKSGGNPGQQGARGGNWKTWSDSLSSSGGVSSLNPYLENEVVGFRIAAVPEPRAMVLTMLFGGLMLINRKR